MRLHPQLKSYWQLMAAGCVWVWPLEVAHTPVGGPHLGTGFRGVTENKKEDMKVVEGEGVGLWLYIYEVK